jgi:hypothetical protein
MTDQQLPQTGQDLHDRAIARHARPRTRATAALVRATFSHGSPPGCRTGPLRESGCCVRQPPRRLGALVEAVYDLRQWTSPREVDTGAMRPWSMVAG